MEDVPKLEVNTEPQPHQMYFASDNWAGIHPSIATNLSAHSTGFSTAYGDSTLDASIEATFASIFEHPVSIFYVSTGTAANCLALTSIAKPGGIVFAHREAHIVTDECGAPEYLSGSLRIATVDGEDGKIDPGLLRQKVKRAAVEDVHSGRPAAISVTQSNEAGGVYSLSELDAIAAVAKEFNLPLHMDGARFANALVSLGCTPAEMTWKRGVDMLSFGATKNGCWCAEAVVFFDPAKAADFKFIRKRAAQLFSKSRFVSAQFEAYFRDGLWLDIARQTNGMAKKLAEAFGGRRTARVPRMPVSNEVFVVIEKETIAAIQEKGAVFYDWPAPVSVVLAENEQLCRFVTSFATTKEDIENLRSALDGF